MQQRCSELDNPGSLSGPRETCLLGSSSGTAHGLAGTPTVTLDTDSVQGVKLVACCHLVQKSLITGFLHLCISTKVYDMLTDLRRVCICDYGFMNVYCPLTEYEELPSIL